jgi:DNA-directed RNA polymerase subunit beta
MAELKVRNFGKIRETVEIPDLVAVQRKGYEEFLQRDAAAMRRANKGLEALFREIFPIESYDKAIILEYLYYELEQPRYNITECRQLRLTYGYPLKITCRLRSKDGKDIAEQAIYLGEIPVMIGGGEFIINGAERVIVSQLHRSPGVDFLIESKEGDRVLHGGRIIPERGSWIEISVTHKDVLVVKIDQSSKIPATVLLRALSPDLGTTEQIIRRFYETKEVPKAKLAPDTWVVRDIVDTESGEIIVKAGAQVGDKLSVIQNAEISSSRSSEVKEREEKVIENDLEKLLKRFYKNEENTGQDKWRKKLEDARTEIMRRGYLKKDELLWVNNYKLFTQPGRSENQAKVIEEIDDERIKEWSKLGIDCLQGNGDPIEIVANAYGELTKRNSIPGVRGGKVSTLLRFLKPDTAAIIDRFVWNELIKHGLLQGKEEKKDAATFSEQEYREYLKTLRRIGECQPKTMRPFEVDNAIWYAIAIEKITVKKEWLVSTRRLDSKGKGGRVEVVEGVRDALIFNTLAEDDCKSHEQALLRFYVRLRPGNPPNQEKAKQFFNEKFFDVNRYRLGKVGRFRLNRKFGTNDDLNQMTLKADDFINTMKYIIGLRNNEGEIDDIDHLGNRRIRTIDELAGSEIRKGLLKLRKTVQERMSTMKDSEQPLRIADLVNSKSVSSSINFFFGRGELSQIVDQTNTLSQLTHERRLSALGPGGLNRRRAGFEVRDVHISHYGRICPVETPEGTNIGLISSLAIFATVDEFGFLLSPYYKVQKGKVTGEVVYMRADEEMKAIFAPPSAVDPQTGKIREGIALARQHGELAQVASDEVSFVDVSPKQIVGLSAALIPFLEHDDANRALMGSNMQRQAVPLLMSEAPLVQTGMEEVAGRYSSMAIRAQKAGTVTDVDSTKVVINHTDEYKLEKFFGLNERTCLNQRPVVKLGEKVEKGRTIADGGGTVDGVLALGRNLLVGFMAYEGFNFEDAIIVSERLVKNDSYTSIHINEFDAEIRETPLGKEEFTNDIPNVSERALRSLDEHGVVQEGTRVQPGDILVGKVVPKGKTELTPEEKLLHAIFGRAGEDVKNDSLELPNGYEGVVIKTERFVRRGAGGEEGKKTLSAQIREYEKEIKAKQCVIFRQMVTALHETFEVDIIDPSTRQKVGVSEDDEVVSEQVENWDIKWVKPAAMREKAEKLADKFLEKIRALEEEKKKRAERLKHGDELPSGVIEMVKVCVATKRTMSIGDKIAGRHGNKGVIAKILPEEDMPFLEDGRPLDILLNPLGVPSRMNVGQILETHLGWVAKVLGFTAITPVFDGAREEDIRQLTEEANELMRRRKEELEKANEPPRDDELFVNVPKGLKTQLYDGRTGEPFDQQATIGYIYIMKLHHLVDDKIHARSTGPYSLITQQPLGGKARTGGQRFGEMEVWALEGYGAAYTLQEMLTVKSDDVEGRTKIYESMVKGQNTLEAGTPLSFDVLCNEIRGLCLNIQLEKKRLGTTVF